MVARKPRIVIIGAGMAGLTAANRLVQAASNECFDLVVVEASNRIGGRIFTSEFGGDRVELGATWIHGIGGSPVYKIAERIGSLESEKPWERMDGFPEDPIVKAEGGLTVDSSIVQSISRLYKTLMDVAQAKSLPDSLHNQIAIDAVELAPRNEDGRLSIGAFVRQGLESFWADQENRLESFCGDQENDPEPAYSRNGNAFTANRKLLEEGVFSIHESTERTYTSADSLLDLDFDAEKEYREFPGEQITIAKGYSTVLKSLASVLPAETIQFGKKVEKIEWTDAGETYSESPVHIHFEDGSVMDADHVIITVSLGVLKAGTGQGSIKGKPQALFHPPLPSCKVNAISKLGFGVVNKLFLEIDPLDEDGLYPSLNFIFSKFGNSQKPASLLHSSCLEYDEEPFHSEQTLFFFLHKFEPKESNPKLRNFSSPGVPRLPVNHNLLLHQNALIISRMVKLLFNCIRKWKMEGLKRCAVNATSLSPIRFMERAATVHGKAASVGRWKMEGLKRCDANDSPLSPIGFMERAATVYGEITSVIYNDSRFTWCQTFDRCRRLASALSSRNISRGDVVSVVAPNIPALYELHFAVPMAGAVLNNVNIRLNAPAMALQFRHCQPKFVFVDYQYLPLVLEAIKGTDHKPCLAVIEEESDTDRGKEYLNATTEITTYHGLLREGDPVFEPRQPKDEWEPIVLNYTSGTTSAPKGVVNSHRAAYISTLNILSMWGIKPRPVFLWTLPMFHNNGWSFPWGIAATGGTNICLRKFDAKLIYSYIQDHGVTHFCAAPVVLSMIANASSSDRKPLPGRVEILTSGATPPSSDLLRMEELGFSVSHGYGLTESGGFVTLCAWKPEWDKLAAVDRSKLRARQGVGVLSLVQVDVKDPASMVTVPRDGKTMGEVMLRGSTVMMGYLNDERSTAKAMEGGWFHTGDLGVIHSDGYLEIKDRSKDIIISGGENISSVEVESVLYCHPMIAEAAVVARPDPFWGETPCAFVSNRVKASDSKLSGVRVSEAEMISFCRERLPHYMVPKTVVFMESLPKTSTGKIQKFLLREMAKLSSISSSPRGVGGMYSSTA